MERTGRNDPCPCGSGKKYKKCCLLKEQNASSRRRDEAAAAKVSLEWLLRFYPDQVHNAIHGLYYGGLKNAEKKALDDITAPFRDIININMGEWLITDAEILLGDRTVKVSDLLQSEEGPPLGTAGRNWIKRMTAQSLGLYEVRQVVPGEGILVKDLLNETRECVWVHEKSASQCLVRWDTLGARLVGTEEGTILSGAMYPLDREEAQACRMKIMRKMKGADKSAHSPRDIAGRAIISEWLRRIMAEQACLVAGAGEDKTHGKFVVDHMRVHDWEGFGSLLAGRDDVKGNQALGWTRIGSGTGGADTGLSSFIPGKRDSLRLFSCTFDSADETLSWIRLEAGDMVDYVLREVADQYTFKPLEAFHGSAAHGSDIGAGRELLAGMNRFYEDWADMPIPSLGDKTPRRAIATAAGRRAVVEILKRLERNDKRRVLLRGGESFDFGALQRALGLDQEFAPLSL